ARPLGGEAVAQGKHVPQEVAAQQRPVEARLGRDGVQNRHPVPGAQVGQLNLARAVGAETRYVAGVAALPGNAPGAAALPPDRGGSQLEAAAGVVVPNIVGREHRPRLPVADLVYLLHQQRRQSVGQNPLIAQVIKLHHALMRKLRSVVAQRRRIGDKRRGGGGQLLARHGRRGHGRTSGCGSGRGGGVRRAWHGRPSGDRQYTHSDSEEKTAAKWQSARAPDALQCARTASACLSGRTLMSPNTVPGRARWRTNNTWPPAWSAGAGPRRWRPSLRPRRWAQKTRQWTDPPPAG